MVRSSRPIDCAATSVVHVLSVLCPILCAQSIAYIRDGNQVPTSVKGIRLNICDVNWRPPQTMLARKMLTDTVTATQCERTTSIRVDGNISSISNARSQRNSVLKPIPVVYFAFFPPRYRRRSTNGHRCSRVRAVVRAVARDLPIHSNAVRSRVYAAFSQLPDCAIEQRSD